MARPWQAAVVAFSLTVTALADPPKDGYPTGSATPEGAACDLARAFIRDDATLFLATCVEPYGSPEEKAAYHKFLEGVVVQMKMSGTGGTPAPDAPKSIIKCYAARHLRQVLPSAAAALGFQDVMFVDVSAQTQSGSTQLCRTLVLKKAEGRWAVEPQPERSTVLSAGLDDESSSTQELAATPATK